MRSIAAAVRIVRDARAGIVLTRAGNPLPLPGLPTHRLLTPGSGVLTAVTERLAEGDLHATFLSPRASDTKDADHARITMLPCPAPAPRHLVAVVAVSPAGDLHGLTGRELVILGLLIDDWTDRRIATELRLPPLDVAESVERIQVKLGAPTRIMATLRALRLGLYVPGSTGPR